MNVVCPTLACWRYKSLSFQLILYQLVTLEPHCKMVIQVYFQGQCNETWPRLVSSKPFNKIFPIA